MRVPHARPPSVVVVACWVVVALACWQGVVASGFTTGDATRPSNAAVVDDEVAAHALAVNSTVHVNATDRLVTVSNDLGRDVTVVVELRSESRDDGDLVLDNATTGDSATFTLAPGESKRVYIDVPDDSSLEGRDVLFDVTADDVGLRVNASNRSVPATAS